MRVSSAIRRGAALAAAAAIAIVGLAATAGTAEAATSYKGKITANGGVTVRPAPSTHAGSKGTIAKGKTISIDCKVPGTKVDGNTLWYALSGNKGWVSAARLQRGRRAEYCPAFDTEFGDGRTTATVNLRSGPHFNDTKAGSLAKGKAVNVVCFVKSSAGVGGNYQWICWTTRSGSPPRT